MAGTESESRDRFRPYPELVEPADAGATDRFRRPYRIVDSSHEDGGVGAVDKMHRRMLVPLDPSGRPVSRHELGHVRWSPLVPPRVRFDPRLLAAVEDARVNLALAARGAPVVLDEASELHVAWLLAGDARRGDVFAVSVRAIASLGTSVEPVLYAMIARRTDEVYGVVRACMERVRAKLEEAREEGASKTGAEAAPEPRARALARELARVLALTGVLDARGRSGSPVRLACRPGFGDEDGGPHEHPERRSRRPSLDDEGMVPAGHLEIAHPPLTHGLRTGRGPRTWVAAREGSIVRYVHRWVSDRAIFRRRAPRSRGTVLVDVSGSMALDAEALDRLLARVTIGTRVAIYSGRDSAGELRIVADAGRRAGPEHLESYGAGNIVDLPALAWLARQPAPRLWVSDGGVTGVDDRPSAELHSRCRAICSRAHIRRVADLDEAARFLGPRQQAVGSARRSIGRRLPV